MCAQAQVESLQSQVSTLRAELGAATATAAGDAAARQRADVDSRNQAAKISQLEALVEDLKQQVCIGGM